MSMHAASLTSDRLKSVLAALSSGPKTSRDLEVLTGGVAIHSDIAELRANGVPVAPARYAGRSESGRKVYVYSLEDRG